MTLAIGIERPRLVERNVLSSESTLFANDIIALALARQTPQQLIIAARQGHQVYTCGPALTACRLLLRHKDMFARHCQREKDLVCARGAPRMRGKLRMRTFYLFGPRMRRLITRVCGLFQLQASWPTTPTASSPSTV